MPHLCDTHTRTLLPFRYKYIRYKFHFISPFYISIYFICFLNSSMYVCMYICMYDFQRGQ